jgi:transposase-like protein
MKREPLAGMLRGTVIADETFIGGAPRNMHKVKRDSMKKPGLIGRGGTAHLQAVVSLIDKGTGEVRSQIIPDITGATLRKAIAEQVDMANSVLHTDRGGQYAALGHEFIEHQSVDHGHGEYVRGDVTTNHAEGYFSQLKRSIDGTHHHVSRKHLPRYLAEFDFRYSTRKLDDTSRTNRLMGQVAGRRLTYRPLSDGQP